MNCIVPCGYHQDGSNYHSNEPPRCSEQLQEDPVVVVVVVVVVVENIPSIPSMPSRPSSTSPPMNHQILEAPSNSTVTFTVFTSGAPAVPSCSVPCSLPLVVTLSRSEVTPMREYDSGVVPREARSLRTGSYSGILARSHVPQQPAPTPRWA